MLLWKLLWKSKPSSSRCPKIFMAYPVASPPLSHPQQQWHFEGSEMFEETVTVWYVALLPNLVQSSPLALQASWTKSVYGADGTVTHTYMGSSAATRPVLWKRDLAAGQAGLPLTCSSCAEDVGLRQPEPEPQPVKKIQKETINEVLTKKRQADGDCRWYVTVEHQPMSCVKIGAWWLGAGRRNVHQAFGEKGAATVATRMRLVEELASIESKRFWRGPFEQTPSALKIKMGQKASK